MITDVNTGIVELAAIAMWRYDHNKTWHELPAHSRDYFRDLAKAAISAYEKGVKDLTPR